MNLVATPESQRPPRRGGWIWPAIVIGLLSMQVGICGVSVYLATSDSSFAIEPDYYRKAVHWDQTRAAQRAGAALGWRMRLTVEPRCDEFGRRLVDLSLVDSGGAALEGARVEAIAFHHARANARQRIELAPQDGGRFSALAPLRRAGLWEFRVRAQRGADIMEETVLLDLPATGASGS